VIVDAQIHVWEEDRPGRPWDPYWGKALHYMLDCGPAVTIDRAIAEMDAVGVAAAIVVSFPLYADVKYALEASARYPERLRTVTHINLDAEHPELEAERLAARLEVVAVRVAFAVAPHGFKRLDQGEFQPVFEAAHRQGVPVMLAISGSTKPSRSPGTRTSASR
jgi:predicted TIM-barrel fold metal-dependent hydrolase